MIDVSGFVSSCQGRPVAVYGLGLSGQASIKALRASGAEVIAWDAREDRRLEAQNAGAVLSAFEGDDLRGCAALVLSPGVPLHFPAPHPVVVKARAWEIPVIGDIEILFRVRQGRRIIGITGTNGKSTTTALIAHILETCGVPAVAGGNIGTPALSLDLPPPEGVFVLEVSSFQMDLCPSFRPDIGVLLNLTTDHIDRHGSFENYVLAKERLFDRSGGHAVIAVDDSHTEAIFRRLSQKEDAPRCVPVSVTKKLSAGVFAQDREIVENMTGENADPVIFPLDPPALPGAHNRQNILAAWAVARIMDIPAPDIAAAVTVFSGLAHRQQVIRKINGVAYVNDSKATNAEATAHALRCYRPVYLIAGGRPKEGGLSGLETLMVDRVRRVFLIGEAMESFAVWLDRQSVPYDLCGTLDRAVEAAHRLAQSERGQPGGTGTVLLSPACASFDQFANFEVRGAQFAQQVMALPEA